MRRSLALVIIISVSSCGGALFREKIPLPACETDTGLCDPPAGWKWRTPTELWAWSQHVVGVRKDGRWSWSFVCVEGEVHGLLGFRGEEVWALCDGEARKGVPPARLAKVELGGTAKGWIDLGSEVLLVRSDGVYGWDGAAFVKLAPAPPAQGTVEVTGGTSRSSFYFMGQHWNGVSWAAVTLDGEADPMPGRGATRVVDGALCFEGRHKLLGAVGLDITAALRQDEGGYAFVDSADCKTALLQGPQGLSVAGPGETPRLLGTAGGYTGYGLGRTFLIDAHRLLQGSPGNLQGSPGELWEYHLP